MDDSALKLACCADLASVLCVTQSLTDLDLCGSSLGDSAMIQLCEGLKHPCCRVQKLDIDRCHLTESCCAALSAVFQMSPSLEDVDLRSNNLCDSGVQQLCEGLRHPDCKMQKIQIKHCFFTDLSCTELASVLSAGASLRELNVGGNEIGDSGMRLLCEGLKHPVCRLRALWVRNCKLSASGCADLSSTLCINTSLTKLVMSYNELGDSGMRHLCEGLKHPGCKIQKLWISECSLTTACCEDVAAVLSTNQQLTELDMGSNALGDSGVKQLCAGLKSPNCRIRLLDLTECTLTGVCFADMASVFTTNDFLRELHFTQNNLEDSFVEQLFEGLKHENCKLQILWLDSCTLTDLCGGPLAGIISTSPSLTELYLGNNKLGDNAVKRICEGLKHPTCRLQTLWMGTNSYTDCCCEVLASAISTCESLNDLDLSWNELGDSGVRLICDGLKHPGCKIKKLCMPGCTLSDGCCADLSSALIMNQSLTEINLAWNELGDSGVKHLCPGLKHPDCQLETLVLDKCSLTASCCADLASVLSTSHSLTALHMYCNKLRDSGMTQLCEGLKHPDCKLQTLGISECSLTGACCSDLAVALRTCSSLTKLELDNNELGISGMRELFEGLKHPGCRVQTLGLSDSFRVGSYCENNPSASCESSSETIDNKPQDPGTENDG